MAEASARHQSPTVKTAFSKTCAIPGKKSNNTIIKMPHPFRMRHFILHFVFGNYSSEIAPTGQLPAQVPQLMQVSASIVY